MFATRRDTRLGGLCFRKRRERNKFAEHATVASLDVCGLKPNFRQAKLPRKLLGCVGLGVDFTFQRPPAGRTFRGAVRVGQGGEFGNFEPGAR